MEKAIELFEDIMKNPVSSKQDLDKLIDRILKNDFLGEKDLHIWDYQIFWNHLRKDVEKKVNKL